MAEPGVTEQLAALIRADIESGKLKGGEKLPSIRTYMQLGYSQPTVARAIEILRVDGLVQSRQGAGNFVKTPFPRIARISPDRVAGDWWASGKAIQDADTGDRKRDVITVVADVVPPEDIADALGVDRGGKVLCRDRKFLVDGRPVQLATSYLPTELTRGTQIEHTVTGPGGTWARLKEQGWKVDSIEEELVARSPRRDEIAAMGLRRHGATVQEITRWAYARGRCVEVTRMVLDPDVYRVVYRMPIN